MMTCSIATLIITILDILCCYAVCFVILSVVILNVMAPTNYAATKARPWTNFSSQDSPWAEFSTLEVAACIPCTYCPVLQYNLT